MCSVRGGVFLKYYTHSGRFTAVGLKCGIDDRDDCAHAYHGEPSADKGCLLCI